MTNTEKIIKYKTSINKIKASTLKELGFKSKTIAKNFAKLTNVNPKEYSNEELLLKALKNKLSMFQKLGLEFNLKRLEIEIYFDRYDVSFYLIFKFLLILI